MILESFDILNKKSDIVIFISAKKKQINSALRKRGKSDLKLLKKIGVGLEISSYNSTTGVVSFTQDHGIAGIMTGVRTGGSGYTSSGTFYNVKVFTNASTQNDSTWNGTLAEVTVSGNEVSNFEITNPGSDMLGKIGYFDNTIMLYCYCLLYTSPSPRDS